MTNSKIVQILIVDDDRDIRSIVSAGVESLGFEALEAKDGETACKIWANDQPALVILDLMMPGMTGKQVCQWIKSQENGKTVPILILTAITQLDDKVDLLDSGADDYLTKPFELRELQARVSALLRVGQLNTALRIKNQELEAAQHTIIDQERQLLALQLGGTAAHQLGQPLTALKLNCHLLEMLPKEDEKFQKAFAAVKADLQRMVELVEKLRNVDAKKTETYHGKEKILDLGGRKGPL